MFNLLKLFKRKQSVNPFNRGWGNRRDAMVMVKEWMFKNNVRFQYVAKMAGLQNVNIKTFLAGGFSHAKTVQKIWDACRKIHDILTSSK